jgi:hypothetical protein
MRRRPMSMVEVLEKLKSHILSWDENYSNWYCGVTPDPSQAERTMSGMAWLCYELASDREARQIELFLRNEGCGFIPNAGGQDVKFVYVYLDPSSKFH